MRLSPVKRHTTERNLERCCPQLSAAERGRLARASFRHYICSVLETGRNWYWPLDRLQSLCDGFVGQELAEQVLASGRGVVVLAPHFGAWEYLGMYLLENSEIAILYKPPSHPGLEQALLSSAVAGASLIPATPTGLRNCTRTLSAPARRGRAPDQQPSAGQGRFAPFFGHPALTGVLVPRLVQRTGCLVLASVCERLPGGRYRVHLLRVGDDIYAEDIDRSLAAMNRAIEDCIAVDPAQYLWSYRRFKTQPEGHADFYAKP
jgi:KDO2-lipid IV(A) lauroyltransferase